MYVVIPYFAQTHHSFIRMSTSHDSGEFLVHAAASFVEFPPSSSKFLGNGARHLFNALISILSWIVSLGTGCGPTREH